jgi:dTDP-4-amino-4,6-dideoxygalactose transaminase
MNIPFNKPYMTGKVLWHISQAPVMGHLAADSSFNKICSAWLEEQQADVIEKVIAAVGEIA